MDQTKNGIINNLVPNEFFLSQNYPNPFKEKTTIKYCVPFKTRVQITIYNSEAKILKKLVDEIKEAGAYEVEFNAALLQKGTYHYKLKTYNYIESKEMILIK